MNVLIPFSWLKDYVKTNAGVRDAASALSEHSFSVEKIIDDDVLEIEVTPNRGDGLSVLGVARELMAVLPAKGFSAEWVKKQIPVTKYSGKDKPKVTISDNSLVPRFSAVVIDRVKVKESPAEIKERLSKVGLRAINNVVDVTNYCMVELGQPMHAFDYDKIGGHEMNVRESKKGEEITTLDGVRRTLPEGVIVIEDGDGRLIDLCGIMGGLNSELDGKTTKVLLFVQVYDPVRIRRSSMSLGHRTDAALRFEKGVDFENVVSSLQTAAGMLAKLSGGEISSELIDITGTVYTEKHIKIDYDKINKIAGIEIKKDFVNATLSSLGFVIKGTDVYVPSWRYDDINIVEDLAEEVVRIYGYQNLPNELPGGTLPHRAKNNNFALEDKAKDFLKYLGFFECYNYSAVSSELSGHGALKIKNPLNADLAYLRTSLTPKLLEILHKNRGYSETVEELGVVGEVSFEIVEQPGGALSCEINFDELANITGEARVYSPLTGFNSIKEDITVVVGDSVTFTDIVDVVTNTDTRVDKVSFKDIYGDALTLSIEFLDRSKQITSEETKSIREWIIKNLDSKYGIKLKSQ
ncbi:MAG: Phenylalanine-tRNA ligase beta subunit [candidate division WWE3 bacterium GW2011_GWA2_42_9]|nr:MAG: Phenylalanine-tRNA ligase beta subunit [candidate division WWE3 bacterium GW2011_GWA2_42_9]